MRHLPPSVISIHQLTANILQQLALNDGAPAGTIQEKTLEVPVSDESETGTEPEQMSSLAPDPSLSPALAEVTSPAHTPDDGRGMSAEKTLEPMEIRSSQSQTEYARLNSDSWSRLETSAQRIIGTAFRLADRLPAAHHGANASFVTDSTGEGPIALAIGQTSRAEAQRNHL